MDVLHGIEVKALAAREAQPSGEFMELDEASPSIGLLMAGAVYCELCSAVNSLLTGKITGNCACLGDHESTLLR